MAIAKLGARALVLILALGAPIAAPAQPSAAPAGGRQTAIDFQHNVVRVIPKTADGQDGPAGFGIIIGERDGRLFIATPDHVARGSEDLTAAPDVIFFAEQGRRYPARRLEELRIPPAQGDLAVIEVARPPAFRPARITIIDPGDVADAAPIWNIGRTERWLVPTSPGGFQGIDVQTNHLMVEDLPTPPGSSGGAVLTERALLGMTLRDSGAQRITYVFRGDRLVEVFQRWQLPVNLVQRSAAAAATPAPAPAPTPSAPKATPPTAAPPVLNAPRSPTPPPQASINAPRVPAAPPPARTGAECNRLGGGPQVVQASIADAIRACETAHRQEPKNATYAYLFGRVLLAAHRGSEAFVPVRVAAGMDHVPAQALLGAMYRSGLGGIPVDHQRAVPWLERAAQGGDVASMYALAVSYAEGKGVTRDDYEAVKWLQPAADRGHVPSQRMLGQMYERGRGTPSVDYTQARQWYEKAAAQGDEEAKTALARLYRNPGMQFVRPSQR